MNTTVKRFSEIPIGSSASITFLVMEATSRTNIKGADYVDLVVSDGEASVPAKLWNTSLFNSGIRVGDVLTAKINSKEYKGSTSLSFQGFKHESDIDASEFLIKPPIPIDEMWKWTEERISRMRTPYKEICSRLVLCQKDDYCRSAAGKMVHHAFLGGLLFHSYRMALSADAMAPLYGCDPDMTVAGCLLHDIGKLKEMTTMWTGAAEYTVQGQLEGHLALGLAMLDEAVRKENISSSLEEVKMLSHIIASHHGSYEFGAIREPMTKEALLIHQLDVTDMQLEVWDEAASTLDKGQTSPLPLPALGHRIYVPDI